MDTQTAQASHSNPSSSSTNTMKIALSTPDSYSKGNGSSNSNDVNEGTRERRLGRSKSSGTKSKNIDADVSMKPPKKPVGRPRRDGLPAGSVTSNGSTKRQRISYSQGEGGDNDRSGHKRRLRADENCGDSWSFEFARTRPDRLVGELMKELDANATVTRDTSDTSGMSVKEAFESHIRSLSSSSSQRLPTLYSILKTFWLPSSPGYFSFAASSSSTGSRLSTHKFFYWDPHPLVFNGIPCPACGLPLHNAGPIRRGPVRVLDIGEEGFYVIGAEYVCQSGLASCEERKTYASTDASILRVLPIKLREEFPVRMMDPESESESEQEDEEEDVWTWNPSTSTAVPPSRGLSRNLWSLILSCLRARLGKEAIVGLVKDMWQDRDLERELELEEGRESDEEELNQNGLEDVYRDAWAANAATNPDSGASATQYPSHATNSNSISHSNIHSTNSNSNLVSLSTSPSFLFTSYDYPSTDANGTGTPSSSTSGTALTPVLAHSAAGATGTGGVNGASPGVILPRSPLSSSSTSSGVYEYPSYEQQQHQAQMHLPLPQPQSTQYSHSNNGNLYPPLNHSPHNHNYSPNLPSQSVSQSHMQQTHLSPPTHPSQLNHHWNESTSSPIPMSSASTSPAPAQSQTNGSAAVQRPFTSHHHHRHQPTPSSPLFQHTPQLAPPSHPSASAPSHSPSPFPASSTTVTTTPSLDTPGPSTPLPPPPRSTTSPSLLTHIPTANQKSPPKPRGPRHCTKCRSTTCKGKVCGTNESQAGEEVCVVG
ncbi:hypothetical protein BT96DRAFT_1027409 [Gymnopus androsaceus JB14]|uniref:Uncharacterized protein n=1 Tax=Gymnopus androsaceus JB14 TaxID=1447944 RepID=A0A6A4GBY8_9AGAR|nr:hypothetical protein BT96DRAFT_1027409 [Gymnopus androsaceus JB14]